MPELPEVETVRRVLNLWCKDQVIKKIHVYYPRVLENSDEQSLNSLLCFKKIIDVKRRGKFLVFDLDDYVMTSHLRMEGKWHYGYFKGSKTLEGFEFDPENREIDKESKHVHFVMELENGQILMYHDVRKFGRIGIYEKINYQDVSPLAKLGKEPFDDSLDSTDLLNLFSKSKYSLKQMLLSQEFIVGVGNIYADEIAFKLGLLPTTPVKDLSLKQCEDLINETRTVLNKAIELGGSTIKSYHAANNVDGKFQNELLCYGKEGVPCIRCGTPLHKTTLNGRGTTYCPSCQKSNLKNRIIGITGAIGSGKSSVSKIINQNGYILLDADKIVRENQEIDKPVYTKMVKLFGDSILNEDKSLNRELIRNIILNNNEMKLKLENLIHPFVKEVIYHELFINPNKKFVLDIPLLFEANMDVVCDKIIFVDIDANIQKERLLARNTMSLEHAKSFEKSILENNYKKGKSDFVINNNGTLEDLEIQIKKILRDL